MANARTDYVEHHADDESRHVCEAGAVRLGSTAIVIHASVGAKASLNPFGARGRSECTGEGTPASIGSTRTY
jgi:hypothetical protein